MFWFYFVATILLVIVSGLMYEHGYETALRDMREASGDESDENVDYGPVGV